MPSLEKELKQLNSTQLVNLGKSSRGLPNDLGPRSQAIAAMMYAAGYTLTESRNVAAMQEKIERKISREFIKTVNGLAMSSPKMFWHVYEPNKIGITQARLFDLSASDKTFKSVMRMELSFKPSKMMTPIPDELKQPGKTGKSVKRRHKFPNKAMSYEYGTTLRIAPKNAKALAFLSDRQGDSSIKLPSGKFINFFYKEIQVDTRKEPTYQKLTQTTNEFISTVAPKLARKVYDGQAKYMKQAGIMAIRKSINLKAPSNSAAKSMGRQIARSMKQ